MHNLLPKDIIIETSFALGAKRDFTFLQSKEGVVFTHADVATRENVRAALAEDDLARSNMLAMVDLNPRILGIGVSAVLGCSSCFLMSHSENTLAF